MNRTFVKRAAKFLHTVSGLGLVGGLAAYLMALWAGPDMNALPEYAAMRESLAFVARWLILPSMVGVLLTGMLAMGLHFPYMEAPWVWLKLLSGVLVFEASLGAIDGPAQKAAELSRKALAGEIDTAAMEAGIRDEWTAGWTLVGLALANIALATWRPRFRFGGRGAPGRSRSDSGD